MRVVVTGATGNVGTAVLRALRDEAAVDEIVGVARGACRRPAAEDAWARADVARDDLEPLLRGADASCTSRGSSSPRATRPSPTRRTSRAARGCSRRPAAPAWGRSSTPRRSGRTRPARRTAPSTSRGRRPAIADLVLLAPQGRGRARARRFEAAHPEMRVVRLRPGLIFQRAAATGIRRLFAGPFLPSPLVRRGLVPSSRATRGCAPRPCTPTTSPTPTGARSSTPDARGAFNIAAEPPLDGDVRREAARRQRGRRPGAACCAAAAALSWRARLQPTEPGWVDMGLGVPVMDTTRARERARLGAARAARPTRCSSCSTACATAPGTRRRRCDRRPRAARCARVARRRFARPRRRAAPSRSAPLLRAVCTGLRCDRMAHGGDFRRRDLRAGTDRRDDAPSCTRRAPTRTCTSARVARLRGPAAGVRGVPRLAADAPAPRAALPPEARRPAARAPAGRCGSTTRRSTSSTTSARPRCRAPGSEEQLLRLDRADLSPSSSTAPSRCGRCGSSRASRTAASR